MAKFSVPDEMREPLARLLDHAAPSMQTEASYVVPRLTYRREANAFTVFAFRNTFLEDLHVRVDGRPLAATPDLFRLTDADMKALMVDTSARLAQLLFLRDHFGFGEFQRAIEAYEGRWCHGWEREAMTFGEVPTVEAAVCSQCHHGLVSSWRFCPACGTPGPGTAHGA